VYVVLQFIKSNMSSDAQDFLIIGRNILRSSQIMNIFGTTLTQGTIHTPFVKVFLCLGNITDGDKVHFKA
jgi:hypothetical protein